MTGGLTKKLEGSQTIQTGELEGKTQVFGYNKKTESFVENVDAD